MSSGSESDQNDSKRKRHDVRRKRRYSDDESPGRHRVRNEKHHRKHRHRSPDHSPSRSKHRERGDRSRDRERHSESRHKSGRRRNNNDENRDNNDQDELVRVKREPEDRGYERPMSREARRENIRDQRRHRELNDERRERNRQKRGDKNFEGVPESQRYGKQEVKEENTEAVPKEEVDFGLSGKLTEDSNTFRGVVIKYSEPPEARKPKRKWRLYPFKGDEALPVLHIHRQSAFLLGRDRLVVDIPIDHPSCSKQHAALQFRLVDYERPDGLVGRRVRPYIIDLESANGTFVNNKKIDAKRYVELIEKDVIKFGFSSREYVVLHDNSKDDEDDLGF